MTTELHVAWVYDCEECGKENFLRAVTGDAHELVRMMSEDVEVVGMYVTEENDVTVAEEQPADLPEDMKMFESPSVIAEIAIAPKTVKCQHCGHTAPAEAPKIDEERL